MFFYKHINSNQEKYPPYLHNVIPGFELFQQQHSLLGLLVALNFVFNHQWDLWDFFNAVP